MDTSFFLHWMFGTQWSVTSAMHALEQAADPDLVVVVVIGLSLLALVDIAVVLAFGEVVAALDEQPVLGVSGNTLGARLAETRVSTELGATHAPDRTGPRVSREGGMLIREMKGLKPHLAWGRFQHRECALLFTRHYVWTSTGPPVVKGPTVASHLGSGAVLLAVKPVVCVPNLPWLRVTTGDSLRRSMDRVGAQLFVHPNSCPLESFPCGSACACVCKCVVVLHVRSPHPLNTVVRRH